jgi:2-octaprenyl-6-methoxyphenol hydroxylase
MTSSDAMPSNAPNASTFDVAVVGGGPVGLTTALNIARACPDARIALIAPEPVWTADVSVATPDLRTAALFHESLELIEHAGAPGLMDRAALLAGIRMVDISDRLLRAPDVLFLARETADETGHDTFGANIANSDITASLERGLSQFVAERPNTITRFNARVLDDPSGHPDHDASDGIALTLDTGGRLHSRVVIAADGRESRTRQNAGIPIKSWDHNQVALTTHFSHARAHGGISTELHGPGGPCTTVPLPGNRSSLVWMERAPVAEALLEGSSEDVAGERFVASLSSRVASFLGPISDVAPPRPVSLKSQIADAFARNRVVLVGDAAHAFPPIGAQGLNLGFRDARAAIELITAALAAGDDPGADSVLTKYHAARSADITARSYGVDLLNRSLISDMPFLPLARGAGLHAVRAIPPLRRLLMRQGMRGLGPLPFPSPFSR